MAGSMNWTRRRYEFAAVVPVVAVFVALYVWSLPTEGPNRSAEVYGFIAAVFVVPITLWLVTSLLLVDQWWKGAGARLSTMDPPGQVLALTVANLPESRQLWGEAMLGELAQVQGRTARWRFALSCARAALSLPLPTRRPVLVIAAAGAAVAAVAAAHTAVGAVLPGLGFFAASFVAFVGVMAVLTTARARAVRPRVAAATVLVICAVAASVVATAAFLLQHPSAAEGLTPARAGILAVALAGCLWLAAAPPLRLGGSRVAVHLGVGAGVIFTLSVPVAQRVNLEGLLPLWLLFGPILTFGVAAFVAAARSRSFQAGVQAGIWSAITVMPLNWAVGLFEQLRQYAIEGVFRFAGDLSSAGFNLGFAFMIFVAIPVIGFPFSVFGAIAGAALRGTPPARNDVPEGTS